MNGTLHANPNIDCILKCDDFFTSLDLSGGVGYIFKTTSNTVFVVGCSFCKACNPMMTEAFALLETIEQEERESWMNIYGSDLMH